MLRLRTSPGTDRAADASLATRGAATHSSCGVRLGCRSPPLPASSVRRLRGRASAAASAGGDVRAPGTDVARPAPFLGVRVVRARRHRPRPLRRGRRRPHCCRHLRREFGRLVRNLDCVPPAGAESDGQAPPAAARPLDDLCAHRRYLYTLSSPSRRCGDPVLAAVWGGATASVVATAAEIHRLVGVSELSTSSSGGQHRRCARPRRIDPGVWAGADGERRHRLRRWSNRLPPGPPRSATRRVRLPRGLARLHHCGPSATSPWCGSSPHSRRPVLGIRRRLSPIARRWRRSRPGARAGASRWPVPSAPAAGPACAWRRPR